LQVALPQQAVDQGLGSDHEHQADPQAWNQVGVYNGCSRHHPNTFCTVKMMLGGWAQITSTKQKFKPGNKWVSMTTSKFVLHCKMMLEGA
jgi:hypothetical protein